MPDAFDLDAAILLLTAMGTDGDRGAESGVDDYL